jgi:N4-gp56 family major capsid protein
MTTGVTKSTNGDISQRTALYAATDMLEYAGPHIVLDKFGDSKPMPKNKSLVQKFRRPKVFGASDTPLVEGITPSATQFGYEDVTATLKQYGQVVTITDVIEDTHEDPVLKDATVQCGDNIGRTIEALTYGVLKAGTNVHYANGTARNQVNTAVSLTKLRAVVRSLKAQKAMKITRVLDGSPDYATMPVEPAYVAVCHTDCESDIRDLAGFVPVSQYGSRKMVHPMEFGSVEELRFISSADLAPLAAAGGTYNATITTVSSDATSSDIYPILVFGKNAYGLVPLRGFNAVEPSVINPSTKTKDDPLGQRGYVGWKTWFTSVILNELWMARLEVAVTEL